MEAEKKYPHSFKSESNIYNAALVLFRLLSHLTDRCRAGFCCCFTFVLTFYVCYALFGKGVESKPRTVLFMLEYLAFLWWYRGRRSWSDLFGELKTIVIVSVLFVIGSPLVKMIATSIPPTPLRVAIESDANALLWLAGFDAQSSRLDFGAAICDALFLVSLMFGVARSALKIFYLKKIGVVDLSASLRWLEMFVGKHFTTPRAFFLQFADGCFPANGKMALRRLMEMEEGLGFVWSGLRSLSVSERKSVRKVLLGVPLWLAESMRDGNAYREEEMKKELAVMSDIVNILDAMNEMDEEISVGRLLSSIKQEYLGVDTVDWSFIFYIKDRKAFGAIDDGLNLLWEYENESS